MRIEPHRARAARELLGYDQEDMAEALHAGVRSVRRWETVGIDPSPTALLYALILRGDAHI